MSEMTQESAGGGNFDLTQFYQIFFEEAGENLEQMEQMLLALDLEAADDEELNAIVRCAHSIKGGAATFGFADVAELTHHMETLLDKLRRHELAASNGMVDVLLQSGDAETRAIWQQLIDVSLAGFNAINSAVIVVALLASAAIRMGNTSSR